MKTLAKLNKNGNTLPSVWSDFFDTNNFFNNRWFEKEFEQTLPAVNIKENDTEFNIEFAAPGFNKNDFKIDLENNVLTISAEKKSESEEKEERYTRKEFSYSTFSRSFTLPQIVNSEKIDAKYNDGILTLSVAKKEEAKKLAKKEIKVA